MQSALSSGAPARAHTLRRSRDVPSAGDAAPGASSRAKTLLGLALVVTVVGALVAPRAGLGQQRSAPLARAVSVQGTVESQRGADSEWLPVKLNDGLEAGDKIRVHQRSRADLALLDRSVLRLNENTTLTIQPVKGQNTGVVDMLRGAVHFFSRGPKSLEVSTPFTTAGVRGTEFLVEVESEVASVTVFEGTVVAENELGSVTLTSGQSAVAEAGKPPVLRIVARPRDAVSWALHYPPVLHFRAEDFAPGPEWQGMVRQSLEAYRQGDIKGAFEGLAGVSEDVSDARFFTYRPHLLLAVGRADEAALDIQRALALSPENADALALQAVVAIVQNRRDEAFEFAQRAVRAAPASATAHVALSYAQQARFDLQGARTSVLKAVELDPQNALAWARLSEIHSSFGNLNASLAAATRAAALEPGLSRTQTVLGFSHLTLVNLGPAKASFEKAIALDSADPLPRLGLGLAKIRENKLAEGARDLEAAASLDPNNAIVRSYLGKAYYEEKRATLDERQYRAAQELDPNDPTPHFYSAIAKQTSNRPVEALHDLQKASELNDNRAVYRSRLMLDSDLAARSASLGRIYADLGFQQLALVEGWKSVNTDPTNFSAHRFLADSYSVLPRHEIARVSELLQAQLLQPLNSTPIQPSLAEANLFLIGASGPGGFSFNEFNPIFNRDRVVLQPGGLVGSNGLYAGETVIAAVQGSASMSAGYTRFQTDGFRVNADQKDDIANAFLQYEVGPRTSLQGEYRYRKNERGDLDTRFYADNFLPGVRTGQETHTFRLGGRHGLSPNSVLLTSLLYRRLDLPFRDDALPPGSGLLFADFHGTQRSVGAEIQHLFRWSRFNLTTGAGYFDLRGRTDITFGIEDLPPPDGAGVFEESFDVDQAARHLNMYAYAHVNVIRDATLTVGASYDRLSAEEEYVPGGGAKQLNPKIGISVTPLPGTTLRAAAFRTLKRTLVADQTLEPTQTAGFNQFFDDYDAADAWRYGAALDQKIGRNVFAGAEYARRDLKTPAVDLRDFENPATVRYESKEDLGRAYVFVTPHRSLSLRLEYVFERLRTERDYADFFVPIEARTHRVPLGLNVFFRSGLSASATATYFLQDAEFFRDSSGEFERARDEFWVVDAALSYRLPRRWGFVAAGVKNALDREFRYFNTDRRNLLIQPERTLFTRLSLAIP
jgi:Flp pilus assembly protein TadD